LRRIEATGRFESGKRLREGPARAYRSSALSLQLASLVHVRVRNFVVMPALVRICARRGEADARINVILARTVAVKVPLGLVQHFAEGHDVKCAELVDVVNAAAGVVKAITPTAGKVKCRGANASQGVTR
jgi:hypothetical protein